MVQYVYKRMISQKRETIGNVLIVSWIVAVLTVCTQIASRLMMMLEDDWYKNSLEVATITDYMIREKMGVIITVVFVIIAIVYLFCVIIYVLKAKLDIVKERGIISEFQVLGYTRMQMSLSLYFGKFIELATSLVFGGLFAGIIWKLLCGQKVFSGFMTILNEDMELNAGFVMINVMLLLIITFPVIYWNMIRNVHIMDMKGEE